MDRALLKERLRGAVRPLVDKLADQVVEMIAAQAETTWRAASSAVLEKLRAHLEAPHAEKHDARPRNRRADRPKSRRSAPAADSRRPRNRRSAARDRDGVDASTPRGRHRAGAEEGARAVEAPAAEAPVKKPRKCRACGETGHRADRCPNETQTVPVVERDSKPEIASPPPSRLDRFARIEAAARAREGRA